MLENKNNQTKKRDKTVALNLTYDEINFLIANLRL